MLRIANLIKRRTGSEAHATVSEILRHGKDFVGCGEAVGQSFTEPPIPTNPRSSFRPIKRIDRATHHRAWDVESPYKP